MAGLAGSGLGDLAGGVAQLSSSSMPQQGRPGSQFTLPQMGLAPLEFMAQAQRMPQLSTPTIPAVSSNEDLLSLLKSLQKG